MLFCMCGTKENKGAFSGPNEITIQPLKSPKKEQYPSKWTSWDNLKPADNYYAGAIQSVTARKYRY